jgi:hypothetical protein
MVGLLTTTALILQMAAIAFGAEGFAVVDDSYVATHMHIFPVDTFSNCTVLKPTTQVHDRHRHSPFEGAEEPGHRRGSQRDCE